MEVFDKHIQKLDDTLEREQQDLSQTMRQHHSDWDNHIFTLSTAAIGFTFAFLPLSGGCFSWLAITGIICFIVAIAMAASNYIYADKGLEYAIETIRIRMDSNLELKKIFGHLDRELDEANENNDIEAHDAAKVKADNKISEIFKNNGLDDVIKDMKKNRSTVMKINYYKTYAFIAGLALVVLFALINIDDL